MSSTTNSAKTRAPKAPEPAARQSGRRSRGVIHETSWDPRQDFTEDEWHDMVAAAATERAGTRSFLGDLAEDDWWEAEARLRERVARAEDEADEKSESAFDLTDHDTWRER
jgi:hypothetical protein